MTGYRLFLMWDGHIRRAEELQADSDAAAIARTEQLRAGQAAELWTGSRMVRAFAAGPSERADDYASRPERRAAGCGGERSDRA